MEITITSILVVLFFTAAGAYLGVLLGRRSRTANETVDRIRQEYEDRIARLKANRETEV